MASVIGQRIVKARKAAGLRQIDLASISGVPQGYLSQIERGLKRPSLDTLRKLRVALNLDEDQWLTWVDAA